MYITSDMKELLELFEKNGVEYLIVGGHAVNFYGYVRTTQDLDVLLFPSESNAEAIMRSLGEFGFAGAGLNKDLFSKEGGAVHLGVEPNRIDLLTSLTGVSNEELFLNPTMVPVGDFEAPIISLDKLIAVKRASKRTRDLADAEELEQLRESD